MELMRGSDLMIEAKKNIIKKGKIIKGKFILNGERYNYFGPVYNNTDICAL